MLSKFSLVGAAVAAAFVFGVSAASAAVIDFTSASTGHSGTVNYTTTWTMTASGVLNNSQAYDGWAGKPTNSPLSFETDGYGVGAKDDEITTTSKTQEWIDVTFSKPTLVNAFYFLDLFVARNRSVYEVGQASVDGGAPFSLVATNIANAGGGGYAAVLFEPIYATVIRFTVLSSNDLLGFADGALAGIGLAPVPVPAAGLMLLGGIGGLAALRRRKRAA